MDAYKHRISLVSTINLAYLAFLIVWQPVRMILLQVDGKGRIPFVFSLLVVAVNFLSNVDFRRFYKQRPFLIWLIWILYAFCNMMIKGYSYDDNTPLFYFINQLFTPFLAMVLAFIESRKNRDLVDKVLIISLSVYCILGFFFMGRVRSGDDSLMTVGNKLAIYGSILVFVLCVSRTDKSISQLPFLILILLSLLMIVATATRKAFGVAVIVLFFYVLSLIKLKPGSIILLIIIAIGAYLSIDYLLDNTYLGERLLNSGETSDEILSYSDSRLVRFVGDRTPHYVLGWELFKQNPITGIGLYNFMSRSGYIERLHTDYMVQLTENGLVGFFLFILFIMWYLKRLGHMFKSQWRNYFFLGLGWICSVLFLGITAWTYDMAPCFICYGVVGSFMCYDNQFK